MPDRLRPKRWFQLNVDIPLLLGIMLLLSVSMLVLYSAGGREVSLLVKQLVRVAVATLLMLGVAQVSSDTLKRVSPQLYVLGCWKKVGHGRVDLHDAIAQSCDVYFYRLANRLGIDKLHAGMTEFGFGLETNVDIPNEPSGLMPSAAWKRRTRGQPWYPGETVITGIGQGYMLVTPIQLASAVATLANRGKPVQPHFVVSTEAQGGELKRMQYPDLEPVEGISPAAYAEVIQAMQDVVHGPRGTARRQGAQIPFLMAGKTGTAQVKSIAQGARYDKNVEKKYRDHSLFVAFAPVDKPRIAIAVVVEHGGSGSKVAAPIAREIVDYYLVDRLHLFSRKAEKDTRNAG